MVLIVQAEEPHAFRKIEPMAKNELPNFFKRREILFSDEISPDEVDRYGDMFLEAGRVNEALDFYEKSGNKERVRRVLQMAEEEGDLGVWMRAKVLLKETPKPAEWERMAERALSAGKEHYAIYALEKAGKQDRAEELKQKTQQPERKEP